MPYPSGRTKHFFGAADEAREVRYEAAQKATEPYNLGLKGLLNTYRHPIKSQRAMDEYHKARAATGRTALAPRGYGNSLYSD